MSNDLRALAPKILAQALMTLRGATVLPLLVNRSYEEDARKHGESVNVPIPSEVPVTDVTPAVGAPAPAAIVSANAVIPLDQWKEAAFTLSDKDRLEAFNGVIPMQVREAVAALATEANKYIHRQYKDVYNFVGTPNTTPFSGSPGSVAIVNTASKVLNENRANNDNRRFVLNPAAEAEALNLRAFQDMSFSGNAIGIIQGKVGTKLGFTFHMDQDVLIHTTGAALTGWLVNGAHATTATGFTSDISIDAAGTIPQPIVGDVLTFAGHTQTYVIKKFTPASGGTSGVAQVSPRLQEALLDNATITFKASHTVNLAFHRDAIAFATRPLEEVEDGLGSIIMSQMDPLTGLVLRLEIRREYKQTRFAYDILYGGLVVRPQLITRVAG